MPLVWLLGLTIALYIGMWGIMTFLILNYVCLFLVFWYKRHTWNMKLATKDYKQSQRPHHLFKDKSYWKKDMFKVLMDEHGAVKDKDGNRV